MRHRSRNGVAAGCLTEGRCRQVGAMSGGQNGLTTDEHAAAIAIGPRQKSDGPRDALGGDVIGYFEPGIVRAEIQNRISGAFCFFRCFRLQLTSSRTQPAQNSRQPVLNSSLNALPYWFVQRDLSNSRRVSTLHDVRNRAASKTSRVHSCVLALDTRIAISFRADALKIYGSVVSLEHPATRATRTSLAFLRVARHHLHRRPQQLALVGVLLA